MPEVVVEETRGSGGDRAGFIEPGPAPFFESRELIHWSFYRAIIAEFMATLLLLYITISTLITHRTASGDGVGFLGIAWCFGGMIFVLVYCTAGISGGHINPAVTFGLCVARRISVSRTLAYMVAQCAGAICGAGIVRGMSRSFYDMYGGGANFVSSGYSKATGLGAEVIGTFILVYTVLSATDPKRNARDSHIPVLAPLPIGFAVFIVHLATLPITGTGINPARSLGPAVIYNKQRIWSDHWIFWAGPFVGAFGAAIYHQYILKAAGIKSVLGRKC